MGDIVYDFLIRKVMNDLDNETTRWYEEAFTATDNSDYWQMLGMAQGLEKAKSIFNQHVSGEKQKGVWGDSPE